MIALFRGGVQGLDLYTNWSLLWNKIFIHQTSGSKETKIIHTYKYGEKQQSKTKYPASKYATLL